MLACLDVHYLPTGEASAACLVFDDWTSSLPRSEHVVFVDGVAPYEPGALYKRELPCLLAVLAVVVAPVHTVIVDAYVVLDRAGTRGLGAHLFEALGGAVTVVGVAKTPYAGATSATDVLRGESASPLHVTALGIDPELAAAHVRTMHGPHRIPTLLRQVDRLARDARRS